MCGERSCDTFAVEKRSWPVQRGHYYPRGMVVVLLCRLACLHMLIVLACYLLLVSTSMPFVLELWLRAILALVSERPLETNCYIKFSVLYLGGLYSHLETVGRLVFYESSLILYSGLLE